METLDKVSSYCFQNVMLSLNINKDPENVENCCDPEELRKIELFSKGRSKVENYTMKTLVFFSVFQSWKRNFSYVSL